MADSQNQFTGQIRDFSRRLTGTQKLAIGGVTLIAMAGFVGLIMLVNQPSFGVLFNNLNPQDASKIVNKLKEREIPYRLDDDGKTVLVPKEKIYDMRLSLAGDGLPQSSVIGYEIFDRTNLGVSDFVQKINYRRALEGELARTILQLAEVEGARVHIVVPERSLFKEDEKSATASVVLKLKSGLPLKNEAIQGITHLVSSSVEGLEASNVTILDSRGFLLSNTTKPNSIAAMTSTQYEMQRSVETYIAQKAKSLLEGVVGLGNALVQVNAELDFRQVERTMEQYDPDKTAVRSEQLTEEKSVESDSIPPSTKSNNVTNYEVTKAVEHVVENVGSIKRLSVAALVNGTQHEVKKDGGTTTEYQPRQQVELEQLTDIVKKAVGFNVQRNDEVSVVNLPFGTGLQKEDLVYEKEPFSDYNDVMEKVLVLVSMIVGFVVLRSLVKALITRISREPFVSNDVLPDAETGLEKATVGQHVDIHLPPVEEEISHEALLRAEKRKRIEEYLQEKPDDGAMLLKVWLAED